MLGSAAGTDDLFDQDRFRTMKDVRLTESRHVIMLYCTLCGNRCSRDTDTGEERPMMFALTCDELALLHGDLASTTCLLCDSPMAISQLGYIGPRPPRDPEPDVS